MKQIKTLVAAFLLLFAAQLSFAQMANWKQQKDFHQVMSGTFHPAEKGDLQPIKMRSMEMISKAEAWKNSTIPAEIQDKKAVKRSLKQLVKGTKKINRSIKSGATDAELTAQLTSLHDTYHTVVGLCKDTEDHDDHEGHNH